MKIWRFMKSFSSLFDPEVKLPPWVTLSKGFQFNLFQLRSQVRFFVSELESSNSGVKNLAPLPKFKLLLPGLTTMPLKESSDAKMCYFRSLSANKRAFSFSFC